MRDAFVAHARGEWTMPPKVYVTNYPAGDFRAMPALGGGHALLKWVTSFPGNPARGLPTVSGIVLVSDAANGELQAVLDAAAVTALRTGAAAVLAAETLGRADAATAAVIGAGVNGRAAARTFLARGRAVALWDVDEARARAVADELGAEVAPSRDEALAADLLVTVTPGHEVVLADGALRPGQHVSLMGADGPGKAEIAVAELARARLFCDDWEQASHGGELAHAVEAGLVVERGRDADSAPCSRATPRAAQSDDEITRSTRRARDPGSRDRDRRARGRDELDLPRLDSSSLLRSALSRLDRTAAAVEDVRDPAVVRVAEPRLRLLGRGRVVGAREHGDVRLGAAVVVVDRRHALLGARDDAVDRSRRKLLAHAAAQLVGVDRACAATRDGAEEHQRDAEQAHQPGRT